MNFNLINLSKPTYLKTKFSILFFLLVSFNSFSQVHINKEWTTETGNPLAYEWQSSITNANNEIISVGNTLNGANGIDILITKFDGDGNILWQDTFNTSSNNNDYGVAVSEYSNGNICVIGTTDNGTTNNSNTVILMYDGNGSIIWNDTYNSSYNKNDNATALKFDINGNIYIAASSETNNTNYDYLLLKYDASGSFQWEARYDYDSLIEIPLTLEIDANNNIAITGASASSINNWDYTIAVFTDGGSLVTDNRIVIPGIGFDKPMSFKKDGLGNFYITGTSSNNGINYDIKTIKLNPSYILQWTATIDEASKDDIGNSLDVDGLGNVYVGGYTTLSNNRKQMILVKYDSIGTEIWRHTQFATNTSGDAFIKAIDVKNNNEIYFIGQELGNNNTQDAILCKIDNYGRINYQKKLNTQLDDMPLSINIANDGGLLITSLKNGTISTYQILKYKELILDTTMVWNSNNGNPEYMKHQLIVRFQPYAINTNAIDNIAGVSEIEFGGIDYFLKRWALDKLNDALAPLCTGMNGTTNNPCGIKAVKIFKEMKTTDTNSVNRLGEIIKVPNFWSALLLEFPVTIDIEQVKNIIDTLNNVIQYSEVNKIAISANINYCNDSSFPYQSSLVYNSMYWQLLGNINIEPAWDIVPDGGKQFIRCGVFDTGVDWKQKDFGYDGINPISSKIIDGWDFSSNVETKALPQGETNLFTSHGTSVTSIISAQRNNNFRIAGIAGGNDSIGSKGISMYNLRILTDSQSTGFVGGSLVSIVDAIKTSTEPLDPFKKYEFGLHIQNHSWRYAENLTGIFDFANNNLLTEAVHYVNRQQVTFVASRGNEGKDNLCYPAIIDDDWVLNVGGTGRNGCYSFFEISNNPQVNSTMSASYGHNVDIGAPSDDAMVKSLKIGDSIQSFSGTSASAPHVSGVVGLLMSYLNDSLPNYKNLAPEDCEKIIEISAKDDTCHVGWDQYIGAGLLDAGKALQLVQKPNKALTHFGTNSASNSTKNLTYIKVDSNKTVTIIEHYLFNSALSTSLPAKKYKVNKYLVTATFNHNLPTNHWADTFWARHSSSNLIQDIYADTLSPRERIKIINCNTNSSTIQGYVYQILDTNNNFIEWWPCNINSINDNVKVEYSVLSHLAPLNSKNYKSLNSEISITPNPTSIQNNISVNLQSNENINIALYNIYGQKINTIFNGFQQKGKVIYVSEVSAFPIGIYFYEIKIGEEKQYFKIIKN